MRIFLALAGTRLLMALLFWFRPEMASAYRVDQSVAAKWSRFSRAFKKALREEDDS